MASPEPVAPAANSTTSADAKRASALVTPGPPSPQHRPSIAAGAAAAALFLTPSPLSPPRKSVFQAAAGAETGPSPASTHRQSTVAGAPGSPQAAGAAATTTEGSPPSSQQRKSVAAGAVPLSGTPAAAAGVAATTTEGSPASSQQRKSVAPGTPAAATTPSSPQAQSPAVGVAASTPSTGAGTGRQSSSTGGSGSSTTLRKTPPTAGWDYSTPLPNRFFRPALTDLCVPVLANNFAKFPGFGNLPADERLRVVEEIALDLPLKLAADLIPEEPYWKRRVQSKWRNCDIAAHGLSWKQLFFERNLAEALERFDRTIERESSLEELMTISAPYVHNLDIVELPSHLSFVMIFNSLQGDLVVLRVQYGNPNNGWNYNRNKWGMKRSDCLSLSSALSNITTTLTSLHLSGNRLDSEKMGILAKGLMANPIVVDLDLSCNFLSDDGVREVAKVVKANNSVLGMLNLASNHITARGCMYLAECEDVNKSLVSLNLCFNLFGDLGGKRIIDWANNNTTIQKLNIESCDIGEHSAQAFVRLMHNTHSALTFINMSGNHAIGVKNGELLLAGLEAGKQMKELWISNCGCGEELENKILTFLVERLFGRTCFHHPAVRDTPAVEPEPKEEVSEEEKKKQEEDKAKEEVEDDVEEGYEEDEEEKKEREEKEKADKIAQEEAAAAEAAEAEAAAAAEAEAQAAAEDGMFHVGHGHDEACTLECSQMVGLPSTKPPLEAVVYPETALAAREAQAAIKEIEDAKPYWGLGAIKDLKDKGEPE